MGSALGTHLSLVGDFVRRDLKQRYTGSVGGLFWFIVTPLVLIGLYVVFFSVILKVRFSSTEGPLEFVKYLLCGLVPWMAFQEAVQRSVHTIVENREIIKKVRFPSEVLPASVIATSYLHHLLGWGAFLAFLAIIGGLRGTFLLLFPILLLQIAFTLGIAFGLSAANVYLRDVGSAVGLGFNLLFYLTPIVYPVSIAPPWVQAILLWNPLTGMIEMYRGVVLEGVFPGVEPLAWTVACSMASLAGGMALFLKLKRGFVDLL
jgi:ABC-type polysaccharide/polyol phosphate export permease